MRCGSRPGYSLRRPQALDRIEEFLAVGIAQLGRASDCGSECRGFESHYPPQPTKNRKKSSRQRNFPSLLESPRPWTPGAPPRSPKRFPSRSWFVLPMGVPVLASEVAASAGILCRQLCLLEHELGCVLREVWWVTIYRQQPTDFPPQVGPHALPLRPVELGHLPDHFRQLTGH